VRIGLDVSKLGAADGLGTFTREALGALWREAGEAHEFLTYDLLGEGVRSRGLPAPSGRKPAVDGLDAFIATSFVAPRLPSSVRLLFVVYDLTFLTLPHCHTAKNRLHCLSGLIEALAAGAELLAISSDGAQELASWLGRDVASIPVLPLAPAPDFKRLALEEAPEETAQLLAPLGLIPGSYVLSVGSLEPRKNIASLLHAHAALPETLRRAFPLVLAGSPGWKNEALAADLDAAETAGFARRLGRVERETLVALYNGAALFAYPSLAEGYGLPIVEAMACGAPVLTSNLSALPETAGGAARLVDPHDGAALTAALAELLDDAEARHELSRLGLQRAASLSWRHTALTLLDLLQTPKRTLP